MTIATDIANPEGCRSSAGFQTCCTADFQIGISRKCGQIAGLEARDTADLEVCATISATRSPSMPRKAKQAKRPQKIRQFFPGTLIENNWQIFEKSPKKHVKITQKTRKF